MSPLLRPMLATPAAPFDAEDYLFEVKWDGIRALAAREGGGRWRLWGRSGADYTPRYPELAVLARLPAGTVVDGELVVLREGRADFPALLRRHQHHEPDRLGWIRSPAQPVVSYLLFDLLCAGGQSLMHAPLLQRRERLRALLGHRQEAGLGYSEGVVGGGQQFFARVVAQGHEGMMAKHLASRYRPGKRAPTWRKIKPATLLPCVIIGYRTGRAGLQRLLLATLRDNELCYVGPLDRGLDGAVRAALAPRLAARRRAQPVVPCPLSACWVEPEVYCQVQCHGWTLRGHLRHARFRGLLADAP